MSLFSSKSEYSLGVDFGTQSIKVIELKKVKGKPYLSNYAWVNVTNVSEVPESYDSDYAKRLSSALQELFEQMKPHVKKATVSIPSFNGLIMVVNFPRMSEKEVADAIKFESRKYIPASLDEVNVSWEILDKEKTENSKDNSTKDSMRVLLAAAPKSEVQYYDNLFKDTDVSIETLELESFSLARAVIGNTKGRFLLVDIGAKTTNIVLVEDGIVFVSRSVDIGGVDMTNAIMQSMNISREKAIAIKESGENFFSGAATVGFPSLDYVANEIKRVLSAQKNDKIESLVLCGGGAKLVGLSEYLEKLTGLTVTFCNPLSHIVYDPNNSGRIEELGEMFAVSIGLALRNFEDKEK